MAKLRPYGISGGVCFAIALFLCGVRIENRLYSDNGDELKSKVEKAVKFMDKPKTENDKLKYEIAEELGLMDKVRSGGWKNLTAKESGRIGGLLAKRKRDKPS